jgi:hypothetical protein
LEETPARAFTRAAASAPEEEVSAEARAFLAAVVAAVFEPDTEPRAWITLSAVEASVELWAIAAATSAGGVEVPPRAALSWVCWLPERLWLELLLEAALLFWLLEAALLWDELALEELLEFALLLLELLFDELSL